MCFMTHGRNFSRWGVRIKIEQPRVREKPPMAGLHVLHDDLIGLAPFVAVAQQVHRNQNLLLLVEELLSACRVAENRLDALDLLAPVPVVPHFVRQHPLERALHLVADREKKFVRQAFGQYLAPELLAKLESSPDGMKLGGESRELTVLFMDVRGFTPLSEALSATELVDFINTLLAPLSDAIQAELGTIDKYIGDSIMAFWNAPVDVTAPTDVLDIGALAKLAGDSGSTTSSG